MVFIGGPIWTWLVSDYRLVCKHKVSMLLPACSLSLSLAHVSGETPLFTSYRELEL